MSIVRFYWTCSSNQQGGFCTNGTPFGLGRTFPLQWVLRALSHAWPFLESEERAESHSEAVYESSPDGPYLFSQVNTSMSHFKIRLLSAYFACFAVYISFANCKCKLDTCTVELSESERRSGWKPLASVLGDAAAAFGCVNRVEELVKQFLRGAVAKLLARPSVQFISCSQDILSRESLNGHALRNKGSKQPVVAFVLGTFP